MRNPSSTRPVQLTMAAMLHCRLAVKRRGLLLASMALLLATASPSQAGVALKLYYDPLTGNAVSDLTGAAIFPSAPTFYEVLTGGLREGVNWGNDFGAWTRGFIEAPQSGQYTLWIASDDDAELWLSTNHDPANLAKIAENVGAVGQLDYTAKPAQKSALITLVRGEKYYFELLHKEGGGDDHCSVAWTLPDGSFEPILPERHVWPYPVNLSDVSYPPITTAPLIRTDYLGMPVTVLPGSISVEENRPAEMLVTIEASQPAYVQWFSNGVAIANANLATYRIPFVGLGQNGDVYSVIVTNSLGSDTASTTLLVSQDTTAPTLVDALNLGNPSGIIAVVFSEAVDPVTGTNAANYIRDNGAAATGARPGNSPDTVLLQTTGLTIGPSFTLTVNNVSDLAATPNVIIPGSTVPVEQLLNTWLRLDESSGPTVFDASGNGRDGSLENGAAPGHLGQVVRSVKFDGVNDHVRLPNGYDNFTSGMTVALWARPTTAGLWARFIDLANAAGNENILFARNGTSDGITFEVYLGGTTGGKVTAPSAIVANQWQHYVAAMDSSGTTILYRNGIPLVTNITGVPTVVTRTNNFVGRSNWGGDGYYGGWMDDLRIYNRVLTEAAVKALAAGAGADDGDPVLPTVTVVASVPATALQNAPPGVFTVTRTGSTAAALTVDYALGGSAVNGVNYTNLTGTVVIPSGSSSGQVFVQPIAFSFTEVQRTVELSLSSSANYNIGNPDSATVTIANNTVAPTPLVATAGNPGVLNTVDVWFASSVTDPSATTFGNYTFNPPLTITNATLGNRSLRVVLQTAESVPPNTVLTVQNVQDPGGNSVTNQLSVHRLLSNPVNLVANTYHSPDNNRPACFGLVTNGIADSVNNAGGFDTWNTGGTDFAGLLYGTSVELFAVKVDLGNQFGDGGSWGSQPRLFRLRSPVDTNTDRPEQETNYWEEVVAPLISGSLFDTAVDPTPSPNTPLVFDLSGLPANQRTAFGWAVGGVAGDGANTFISISELSGFGVQGAIPAIQLATTPGNFNVIAGQRAKLKVWTTYPVTYQWQKDGGDIFGETKSYYGVPPVSPTDNNAVFNAALSYGGGVLTNISATLAVLPRATPPVVRDATLDPSNSVIYVWFDESVEPGTAQSIANYALNDAGLSLIGIAQDAQGFRIILTYSGTPGVADLLLTVSGVRDLSGNEITSQIVPVVGLASPASRVVANSYQQGRATALTRSTDGIIMNDANVTTWTTFGGSVPATDFVGLGYPEAQVFSAVVMDLGWQFGDGGDWSEQPRVFIQKTPVDTNQTAPEDDPTDWVEVPGVLMSGNVFDGQIAVPTGTTPLPNATISFDLAQLPLDQRTGFGWAIGGVRGNAIPGQARFVTVAELRGFGIPVSSFTNVAGPPEFAIDVQPTSYTKLAGAKLTLYTAVTGTQPIHYQWQHNGANLTDSGRIIGANSNALTIVELFGTDAGSYQLIVTNSAGSNASVVATVSVTTGIANLNGGTNWTTTGGANIAGDLLQLTTGFSQAMSAFLNDPLYIGAFHASFTYQDVGGGGADGAVFVLQNSPAGPAAVGGAGGSQGYAAAVAPSVGLVLNIYNNGTTILPGYSLGINGALNAPPYLSTAPVNLAGGNPIAVRVSYDGTIVSMNLTDTVTSDTFSTSAPLDIPTTVGGSTAYVGFTAGSGGLASNQRVTEFMFTSLPNLSIEQTAANTFTFTWPLAVGNFLLQSSPSLTAPSWANVLTTIDVVGGRNQATVSAQAGNQYFRLLLQ